LNDLKQDVMNGDSRVNWNLHSVPKGRLSLAQDAVLGGRTQIG
jgi:hypothetical protein